MLETHPHPRLDMEYSIEQIDQIAGLVVAVVKKALAGKAEAGKPPQLHEVETTMRQVLKAAGGQALGAYLSSAEGTPSSKRPCACGGELIYQRRRSATVLSVFGRVAYKRAYYAGCACGHGQAPLDEHLGIEAGKVSAGLSELLALAGVEMAFEQGRDWLKPFLLFEVSENTVRQETELFGEVQQAVEEEQCQHSQQEEFLQKRLRMTADAPRRMYGSIDAAKVRIEPRKAAEKQGKRDEWRDMKVGCWYEAEAVPAGWQSKRQREKSEREQGVHRAKDIRYYCDIMEASEFGKLMWGTGCEAKADLANELVFVCDGATWIWNLVGQYYPHAKQIVDWYHAEERLERVAAAAFADVEKRGAWLKESLDELWAGQVDGVSERCQQLAGKCDEAQQAAGYFAHNAHRMRYDLFRAAGYLIGSGTVESACKQIVTHRLKRSGAQWTVTGAVQTAKARAAWLSGQWNTLASRRAQLPLAA